MHASLRAGEKSIECRGYPPPQELQGGAKVWLAASQGPEGVASFGDAVEAGQPGGQLVGWVLFDGAPVEYTNPDRFAADQAMHCVPADSPYAPVPGGPPVYGWRVVASHRLAQPLPLPAMRRVVRSLYHLC